LQEILSFLLIYIPATDFSFNNDWCAFLFKWMNNL
jgi:hypothetical protein